MHATMLLHSHVLPPAAARSGVCSSSPRCSPASVAPARRAPRGSVLRTIAPDRSEAAALYWQFQQQQERLLDRGNGELEAMRRTLNASMSLEASIRRPLEHCDPFAKDCTAPSLGWRWLPHQLMPTELFAKMKTEAKATMASEPYLSTFLHNSVLSHDSLGSAVAALLGAKLGHATLPASAVAALYREAYTRAPDLLEGMAADINAAFDRDPACGQYVQGMLHFKGVQALLSHRVAHWLWIHGRKALAHALQSRASEVFHVDIHPGAQLGWGVMMDHATGIVIGETAVLGDNVSMLHHVTLGGSGTGRGIRHPTVGHGVLLGAGVSVLGPIMIGAGSKVGAGSVVVRDLPNHCVAVGVPARIVKYDIKAEPVQDMDQTADFIQDYVI